MEFVDLLLFYKKLWCKINCVCGRHVWDMVFDTSCCSSHRFQMIHRQNRACVYCGKYQYRELYPTKEFSQIYKEKWIDVGFIYKTGTQKAYADAKKLSNDALYISNELSKFDSCVEQKTKVFMHLVNASRKLSEGFMKLKTEIRELHIEKQKDDINKAKSN